MIVEKGCVILFTLVKPKRCAMALAGSAILAFGLYNVHALSGVTEGGILGMTLLLNHWFRTTDPWYRLAPASGNVLTVEWEMYAY